MMKNNNKSTAPAKYQMTQIYKMLPIQTVHAQNAYRLIQMLLTSLKMISNEKYSDKRNLQIEYHQRQVRKITIKIGKSKTTINQLDTIEAHIQVQIEKLSRKTTSQIKIPKILNIISIINQIMTISTTDKTILHLKILTTIFQLLNKEQDNIQNKENNQKIKISNFLFIFNRKEKQLLKQKIKQNLEILKYTVNNINQQKPKNENQPQPAHFSYKWNHKPLISQDIQKIRKSKKESKHRINLIKKQKQQKVQTNLEKIIPQFQQNRQQILSEIKQERLQKFKDKKGCPHDHCPKHHMRTPVQDIKRIQKFIQKQAQKYTQKLKKEKQLEQQKQKIKKAKLRAIDIKCQQKLTKSKKYDPSQSRTSFHLSIDHFSTFSDLKVHKKQLDQQKKHKKEVRKMMKQKGGRLEQAIYQDLQQQNQLNQLPDNTKIKQSKNAGKKLKQYELEDQRKPYCEKIIKQAKINSPKKIKQKDAQYLKNKKQKPKKSINLVEQKKKTKQVELQIQRKKRQLMRQYKRQKELNESKNEKLKNSHKRKLQAQQFQVYV